MVRDNEMKSKEFVEIHVKLTPEKGKVVFDALQKVMTEHSISDVSQAMFLLCEKYLQIA